MGLIRVLLKQCRYPSGTLGRMLLHTMNMAHSGLVDWGLARISRPAGAQILDIGCGGGKAVQVLLQRYEQSTVWGIDPSETAIQASAKRNKTAMESGRLVLKEAVAEAIPADDQSFDLVTAFQTHYFWPDLKESFSEVFRVLRPGGQFLLVSEIYKINYHMTEYKTVGELESLSLAAGFATTDTFTDGKLICLVSKKVE